MAGLFSSKKNKKDRDDASSTNSGSNYNNSNQRYQQGRPSTASQSRDNFSANNSTSHSQSDYLYNNGNNNTNGSFHHSSSQQQLSNYQHQHSATSFSTHQSNGTSLTSGPWSSGVVMSTNPFPRFSHTASFVNTGNDIYIYGGIVKGSVQKDIHVIDAQSLHCQMLPVGGDAPSAANGHTAVSLGQYIMYFGGKDAKGKTSDTLYVFHTGRKEWNKPSIQSLQPAPRHSHAACVIGTIMYITCGQLSGFYMNDIVAFDMKTLNGKNPVWTMIEPKSTMPPARAGHCAAAYDGKVYIFGGADDKYYYNDIWCFDPSNKRWEAVPAYGNLPTSRQGHTCVVIEDTMYIYGGMNHEDQLLGDLCAFKFTERRWITIAVTEAASARTEHAMCNVGDRIYIFGGQLHLNANEDSGLIHVLETSKIRWSDPSGSQRSAYDNESTARTDMGMDDRSSSYSRPSHTTDSQRAVAHNGHDQGSHSGDSRRGPHQQQQQHIDRSDSYASQQQHHQQPQQHQQQQRYQNQNQQQQQHQRQQDHQDQVYSQSDMSGSRSRLTPADDSQVGQRSPSRLSIELNEATHVGRRRTIGKPVGYVVPETEIRGTQSIDEVRRPVNESLDLEMSRASPVQIQRASLHQGTHGGSTGVDSEDRIAVAYSPSNGIRQQKSTASIHAQFSHLDLNRQGSNASSVTETLNRQESYASTITANTTQVNGRTTGSRSPLKVVNPGQESEMVNRSYHQSSSSSSNNSSSELQELKQREQWLMAEVSMARKKIGDRPLSMAIMALEDELENCEVDSEKYRIMQALLNVKAELERSKTTIATQAQIASNKVREAERVRTSALQEAAYLKAKVSALESGEVSALVSTETARAMDLEKRLTSALAQLDKYEAQFVQYETILENEKHSREAAEDREREASSRADDAQMAHTRALTELTNLHERASVAEASLRETVAKSATSEAGLSSYQQQSAALFSQISTLKTTVDHQKKSLEKVKMAYSVANERAEHADKMWSQSRRDMDQTQLEMASVRADMDRAQRESEHWKSKASETELLWQKAKKENETMRALLEDDMNAAYSPTSNDRKHDSIMAITSASRLAELEHELTTLRGLLKESQEALTVANKDLGDTMLRLSQLEQTSMTARAEAATAQRQLTEYRGKVTLLQTQLIRKEEVIEEMVKEQENNEAQLGLLRRVMKDNGMQADDLILEALSKGSTTSTDGRSSATGGAVLPLKQKVQEAEKRAAEAEKQVEELTKLKVGLEGRIQQLEADYQTAMHYVQGTETMLQRLRDEAQAAKGEKDALRASLKDLENKHAQCDTSGSGSGSELTAELEEEIADLHRQLQGSHERSVELEKQIKAFSNQAGSYSQGQLEAVERTLAETRKQLDLSQEELQQAHELNKVTGQELEDALDALKKNKSSGNNNTGLEASMENAQRTISNLQRTNKDLEEQLRASENKISLLLDNFQSAPESVRNSVASLSALMGIHGGSAAGDDYMRFMESSSHGHGGHGLSGQHGHGQYRSMMNSSYATSPPLSGMSSRSHMTSPSSMSPSGESMRSPTSSSFQSRMNGRSTNGGGGAAAGSGSFRSETGSGSTSAMSNSQKLEEYEKMIDEMTNARRHYDE
ncbi:Negative regulator of mitotic exit [Linnemannia schmuckeri]|uniref:Negative regulator of mitotic exit n=1 Tax=Linnemannia schmuckeri TaxID=64567 RepID=A0A9P5S425_9FUNG|nr:Negative regulator of mitotic exit [Linnemannia schmuckeri]